MMRWHLFEFEDQPWFPKLIRNLITDILGFLVKDDFYAPVIDKIKKILIHCECKQIVDLCSGSGEGALYLQQALAYENYPIQLVLTDKYPPIEKVKKLTQKTVSYLPHSVNALALPASLTGMRTIFAAFHHFKPESAQAILADAVKHHAPIAIFEYTERSWLRIGLMFLAFFYVLLITPLIKPFTFSRFFYTYIVPIAPLIFCVDGIISHLRTYQSIDLNKMIKALGVTHYSWEMGAYRTKKWGMKVTYLFGWPT